jgi:hypothetical protein
LDREVPTAKQLVGLGHATSRSNVPPPALVLTLGIVILAQLVPFQRSANASPHWPLA